MPLTKILYIARGGAISGSQRQLLNLLHRLDKSVYEPLVVCSEGGDLAKKLAEIHVETLVHPHFFGWRTTRHLLHRYLFRAQLLKQCAAHKIDLVHCFYPWYSQYSLYLAKKMGCPCVVQASGLLRRDMIKHHNIASADGVIAISKRIQNDLLNAGVPAEKVSLVFDGIDVDCFCPQSRNPRPFNTNGEFIFGLVGRIEPAKRQMEFVGAARLLAARHDHVKFVIVGETKNLSYTRLVKRCIENAGLSNRIFLVGRCENMPTVLSGFDVLVSLSGGSVMYEAMACGVPVLSAGFTPKEYATHVIDGHNAIRLDSRNPDALAWAMEKLLSDAPYRRLLAANTRPHIRQHLDVRITAQQTEQLYSRLLGREHQDLQDSQV